jgi:hypothetical protein
MSFIEIPPRERACHLHAIGEISGARCLLTWTVYSRSIAAVAVDIPGAGAEAVTIS